MFAYCGNNPIIFTDCLGEKYELALAMYNLAADGDSDEYDFSDDKVIGTMLKNNLYTSDCFKNAIIKCIPDGPFGISNGPINTYLDPYSYSTKADKELVYSVGKANLQIEFTEYRLEPSCKEYHVHYVLTDVYNFEFWTGRSLGITLLNNLGGWLPQELGILSEYKWSISGDYTLYIPNDNYQPTGGGGGHWKLQKM